MSALNGLAIDNLIVEIDAPEIPIMDGSGATFVYLIRNAGILEQPVPRRFVRVKKTVEVRDVGSSRTAQRHDSRFCNRFRSSGD